MSNKEILEKAIQKAIDGGWSILQRYEAPSWWIETSIRDWMGDSCSMAVGVEGTGPVIVLIPARSVLLDHDFAKALWGEHLGLNDALPYIKKGATLKHLNRVNAWQYHLQRMVIAENPIKYLGEHLDD